MSSPLEQFDIINVKSLHTSVWDISFNNILVPLLLIIMMCVMYMYMFSNNYNMMSNYFQNLFEQLYLFLMNLMKQQAHQYGLFWAPFMYTLFTFILFCNLLSLMPFGMAMTSHLILIFLLSSTICMSMFIMGLLRFNLKFLHMFMPQCPFVLLPILMPIEIFSYLMRLFSLSMSLAANMLAGHTLVHMIVSFILNLTKIDLMLSMLFLMPLFLILVLEFGVALLQAYVFTVLVCMYLSDTEKLGAH